MKTLLIITSAVTLSATALFAGDGKTFKDKVPVEVETCKFRSNELQIDAFAAGAFSDNGRPFWGGGLGVNYFFTKFTGIGVEQMIGGRTGESAVWGTAGNFFLRYPICSINLAPYAMIGGGFAYGEGRRGHGFGSVGGGLEYRVTDNIGLFSDARWIYSSEDPESAVLGRAGVRFAF